MTRPDSMPLKYHKDDKEGKYKPVVDDKNDAVYLGAYSIYTSQWCLEQKLSQPGSYVSCIVVISQNRLSADIFAYLAVISGPIGLFFMYKLYRIPARPF
jgi:hypothetical protein